MTQELVLVVLLSGLLGLVWVMTLAVWEGKQPKAETQESEGSSHGNEAHKGALKHHSVAA
jgi:hypothetical protein